MSCDHWPVKWKCQTYQMRSGYMRR